MPNNNIQPKYAYPDETLECGQVDSLTFGDYECDILLVSPEKVVTKTPTIIVPGFTEGIVQDAKFAKALSDELGGDVIVLGQYRREIKQFINPQDAINNQADALLELIRKTESMNKPINIVTSSMGSIIFAVAAEKAHGFGWTCFEEDANIVFISPAGTKLDEKRNQLLRRFLKESMSSGNDNWDKESLDAGPNLVKQDPKKYLAEGLATIKATIDYNRLQELRISPHVITNPNDILLGQDALNDSIKQLLSSGQLQSWTTPWINPAELGSKDTPNSETRHNAHMVNDISAKRAAAAAARLLSQE